MEKKYVLLTLFVFVFLLTNIFDGVGFCLRVIPNAPWQHGFGIDTPAGSGRHLETPSTNVIKVTNLNDSGPGSLRNAIAQALTGPVTVVFEVSGTIELQSNLGLPSYLTIAGQTAPSPGITIKNKTVSINRNFHDILIQHIRIRTGDKLVGDNPDAVDVMTIDNHYRVDPDGDGPDIAWTPPYNIVIDHCSLSWSIDEVIDTGGNDITFSNNIISEGLSSPLHSKGGHSKGLIVQAYNYGISGAHNTLIANNLFVHNASRNPSIFAGKLVVANNVLYDYKIGIKTDDGNVKSGPIQMSLVGNYVIDSSIENPMPVYICAGVQAETRIYLSDDNFFMGMIHTDPWNTIHPNHQRLTVSDASSSVPDWARASSPPIWPTGYTAMSAADARTYVLASAGARPADRDSVDMRIVNDVKNGTGGIIASQNDVGGWPNLAKNTRTLTVPSNPNEVQASGYTKLEEWLHEFSRTVEGKPGRPGTLTY